MAGVHELLGVAAGHCLEEEQVLLTIEPRLSTKRSGLDLQAASLFSSGCRCGLKLSLFKSRIISRVLTEAILSLTFKAPGTQSQQVMVIMIDTRSNSI